VIGENFRDGARDGLLEEEAGTLRGHFGEAGWRLAIGVAVGERTASHVPRYGALVHGATKNQALFLGYQIPSVSPADRNEVISHHASQLR
jgi:hypothetical protein